MSARSTRWSALVSLVLLLGTILVGPVSARPVGGGGDSGLGKMLTRGSSFLPSSSRREPTTGSASTSYEGSTSSSTAPSSPGSPSWTSGPENSDVSTSSHSFVEHSLSEGQSKAPRRPPVSAAGASKADHETQPPKSGPRQDQDITSDLDLTHPCCQTDKGDQHHIYLEKLLRHQGSEHPEGLGGGERTMTRHRQQWLLHQPGKTKEQMPAWLLASAPMKGKTVTASREPPPAGYETAEKRRGYRRRWERQGNDPADLPAWAKPSRGRSNEASMMGNLLGPSRLEIERARRMKIVRTHDGDQWPKGLPKKSRHSLADARGMWRLANQGKSALDFPAWLEFKCSGRGRLLNNESAARKGQRPEARIEGKKRRQAAVESPIHPEHSQADSQHSEEPKPSSAREGETTPDLRSTLRQQTPHVPRKRRRVLIGHRGAAVNNPPSPHAPLVPAPSASPIQVHQPEGNPVGRGQVVLLRPAIKQTPHVPTKERRIDDDRHRLDPPSPHAPLVHAPTASPIQVRQPEGNPVGRGQVALLRPAVKPNPWAQYIPDGRGSSAHGFDG